MKQKTRDGILTEYQDGQDRFLSMLYGSTLGRIVLKPLTAPPLSRLAGRFLSTGISRVFIRSFIRSNHIDMTQYEPGPFPSYNAFFSRKILPKPMNWLPPYAK